jgi:hypothetical protein
MKHLPHYISLIGILAAGLLGFYVFSYDRLFQIGIAVALALSYISWGIVHHFVHKDICFAVVLEYVAVAILGLVAVLSLIYRS